jgi:hypothetical protein
VITAPERSTTTGAEEKEVRMIKDEVAGDVAGWSKEQLIAIRRLVSKVADAGVCVKM